MGMAILCKNTKFMQYIASLVSGMTNNLFDNIYFCIYILIILRFSAFIAIIHIFSDIFTHNIAVLCQFIFFVPNLFIDLLLNDNNIYH